VFFYIIHRCFLWHGLYLLFAFAVIASDVVLNDLTGHKTLSGFCTGAVAFWAIYHVFLLLLSMYKSYTMHMHKSNKKNPRLS
jgi:uncharacterized membrane protein YeiB